MREDIWTHRTGVTVGVNNDIGSPRAWLNRAFDSRHRELSLADGSIYPKQLTVAGIWRRGHALPIINVYGLYRFFRMKELESIMRGVQGRERRWYDAVGLVVAEPFNNIIDTRQRFYEAGAEWIWWSRPGNVPAPETQQRQTIDHQAVYELLESGMDPIDIARKMKYKIDSVKYVKRKWEEGLPVKIQREPTYDRSAVEEAIRSGRVRKEIAQEFGISGFTVHKIAAEIGEVTPYQKCK